MFNFKAEVHCFIQQSDFISPQYAVYTVPRSREVKQSWITSLFTTLYASFYSLRLVFQLRPQVVSDFDRH